MQQLKITQSMTDRSRTVDDYLKDINAIPMVSPEEETELAARIQSGDEVALARLVEANLRFVVSVAKTYQNQGLDLCDLINEGNIGLIKAASRFDPTRGFKFISYAVWWVRQQILQSIYDRGRVIRIPLNQAGNISKINKEKARFFQDNGREPTDAELSEFMDLTPEKIGEAVACSSKHLSLDTPFSDEDDGSLIDVLPDETSPAADQGVCDESLRTDIDDAMKVLTPRERTIVTLAFGIGCREMTLEEISAMLCLTRERVRQVKQKAIHKLSRPAVKAMLAQYL